jgi:hypothetical protein
MDNAPDTTPAPTPKPRGRPATGKAQTAAQRQREYRQRLKAAPHDAAGQIKPLGRVALVKLLNEQLVTLEDAQQVDGHSRARWQLGRIMCELVTRYGIELE